MLSAISRRAVLASPVLMAVSPAAAAPIASDELRWMIDTYEEVAAQRIAVVAELERLVAIPDQPQAPEVFLFEAISRDLDYPPEWRQKVFHTESGISRFFRNMRDYVPSKRGDWRVRIDADENKALALYRERRAARERWTAESGMDALDEQDASLFGKLAEIEEWICEYVCQSVPDVVALASFAGKWLPDDELGIGARSRILRSISDYAVAAA